MKIIVIGGGAFGTAVGAAMANSGNEVTLFVRNSVQAESINNNRRNLKYLPDFKLPRNLRASTQDSCLKDADVVFLAVPSLSVEKTCQQIRENLPRNACIVNLSKGLHSQHMTMNRAIAAILPDAVVGSLKGPNFARPLLHGLPSGMTLAMNSLPRRQAIAGLFKNSKIQIELWHNVDDVEFVSALKNVLAIAMGICDAIEENPNTRFLIMQKLINEARDLLSRLGFNKEVLFTYAGLGDLLMTALNDTSRNRTLGLLIGRGFELAVNETGPVLEGKRSVRLICERLGADAVQHAVINGLNAVFEHSMAPEKFFNLLTEQWADAGEADFHMQLEDSKLIASA